MTNLAKMVAAASLGAFFAWPVPGYAKPLPPAFGKELVSPDNNRERESDEDEIAEKEVVRKKPANPGTFRPASRGQKLHIHLDGDVDGGGDDGSGRARSRGRGRGDGGDDDTGSADDF